jgi:hypothetical protein
MQLSGVLWYHLQRRGDCPNLHEADHLVLVLGDKETVLFCRRECQFPPPRKAPPGRAGAASGMNS